MIESLHANIAIITVRSSRRTVYVTLVTKLYLKTVSLDGTSIYLLYVSHDSIFVFRVDGYADEVLIFVIRHDLRDHAWICKAYLDQYYLYDDVKNDAYNN